MDLKEFMDKKYPKHFAETLVWGDKIKVTIRHKTDGNKNLVNVNVIFIRCYYDKKEVDVYYGGDGKTMQFGDYIISVPFNEIRQCKKLSPIIPQKLINETRQVGICEKCGSSLIRKYWIYLWGKKYCINKECNNNKKNVIK